MSDVPQAPYGEEGDARPVSLIGARIPTSSGPAEDAGSAGDQVNTAREERLAKRRRRRGAGPATPPGAHDAQAFHLHDTATAADAAAEVDADTDAGTDVAADAPWDDQPGPDDNPWPNDDSPPAAAHRTPPIRTSAARSRPAGRPSAVPPPATGPSTPAAPTTPAATTADHSEASRREAGRREASPPEPLPPPPPGYVPVPSREIVIAPPAGTPPALLDETDAELRPWQEPFDGAGDLEPWEEIPVRLSPTDRASALLEGSWRVAVTSLFAGSGTTTVTAGLGMILADVRGEDVVAVDASLAGELMSKGGSAADEPPPEAAALGISLTRRLGAHPATTISGLAGHRADPYPPADMVMLVSGEDAARQAGALDVVAARTADLRSDRRQPGALVPTDDLVTPTTLRAALRLLSEGYPLVLLDAPGDSPLTPTVLRGADVVVLVVLATPTDLDAAAADLRDPDGMSARLGEPPPPVIAVVVSARRGRWSPQTRAAAARLSRRVDGLIRLPYDVRLDNDAGAPTPIGRLRRRSRRAFLGLAAVLVDALVDEADTLAAGSGVGHGDGVRQPGFETSATSSWDLEKGSGVSSDHLRSASPTGDAPDPPGGNQSARKDP